MIELKNISFKYKTSLPYVLKDINFKINSKEKILIVGKNGAGKTTLSKIISGVIPILEKGILEGELINCDLSKTGILFQDFEAQLVTTSVKEELIFFPLNKGIAYKDILPYAENLAEKFKIKDLFERDITELSGGEKQKVALLALLSANPEIIILDEPFTDLDPVSRESTLDFLKNELYNKTLIVFDQLLNYYEYFDRLIILNEGKIDYDGNKEIIYKNEIVERAGLELPLVSKIFPGIETEKADLFIMNNFIFNEKKYLELKNSFTEKNNPIIKVKNLNYKYPESKNYALKNINFEINEKDFVVIAGANGSGKTTLMKIIAGIIPIKEKTVELKKGLNIGYVYQNPDNQIFAETVFEEVSFILKMAKCSQDVIKQKTENILKVMGLFEKKDEDPFLLPKGDRQKVACASILVAEPDVVILDEPTTGLDYPSLKNLMNIIENLNKAGSTILMITHDMEVAADYGDKMLLMSEGEILFYGNKRDAFSNEEILKKTKIRTTKLMDITVAANGRLLLNEKEFLLCWSKK